MDDKLKLLIDHYNIEVVTLQRLIKEELDTENNYEAASWYQKGVNIAKSELHILHSLNGPFYSKKEKIIQQLNWIRQKRSESKEGDENHIKFSILLQFVEEKYEALSGEEPQPLPDSRSYLFEEAIDKVFAKEIKGVNLIINENTGFRFEIICKRNRVDISIPYRKRRGETARFDEYELKRFAKLGFEVKKKPLRLFKSFLLKQKEAASDLKILLARYYFEVQYSIPIQRQGYIEYIY